MQVILYDVFETDADLVELKLVHQGFSRDIAESVMAKKFLANYGQVDYMMVNHHTHDLHGFLLSDQTRAKRGEPL